MTVESQTSEISAVGDGVQTVFPYNFIVYSADTMFYFFDGVEQILSPIVSGLGNPAGGAVTFAVAPGNGVTVTMIRILPLTQTTDYQPFSAFPAETVERNLDEATMKIQQIETQLDTRVVRIPIGFPNTSTDLPPPEASKVLGWNSTETALTNYDLIDIVQRVILVSGQPDGVQTGIGAAWVTAGDTVNGSITIAFYGATSYLLSDTSNPQLDVSWLKVGTEQTYGDLIALGAVVGYWPALDLVTQIPLLVAGQVVIGESTLGAYRTLYQCEVGGDYTTDPNADVYDDGGFGTNYIDLLVANAPVHRDEFIALQDGVATFATTIIVSGLFIGFQNDWVSTLIGEVRFGLCGGYGGVGAIDLERVNSPLSKDISGFWEQGNANGGLVDPVTLTANTWYTKHMLGAFFVVPEVDADWCWSSATDLDGAVALADANVSTAGYNTTRQIGWDYADASSEIRKYHTEDGGRVMYDTPVTSVAAYLVDWTAAVLITLDAPPNSIAIISIWSQSALNGNWMNQCRVWPSDEPDVPVTPENSQVQAMRQLGDTVMNQTNDFLVRLDENSQAFIRAGKFAVPAVPNDNNTSHFGVSTKGFRYLPEEHS